MAGDCEAILALILRANPDLPGWETHYRFDKTRRHLDVAFADYSVGIEVQEETCHGHWRKQTEDAKKLNDLQLLGWLVLHFTGTMLQDPDYVIGTIRNALGMGGECHAP